MAVARTSRDRAPLASVEELVADIRRGKMVILIDDEDRENEGDLTMAAEKVTPEAINFMAKHGRGLICLTLEEQKVRNLGLPPMASDNTALRDGLHCSIEAAA
jgi:3,4-dihydroxy 2-butanone 4-phosphate synthase/GTP cyclohydrolase II